MIKMLLVDSEDDYGALDFDKGNATIHEAYQLAEDSGGYYETDDGIEYKSYTFKEVDKEFIKMINLEFIDEDLLKHKKYYIVE